MGLSRLAMAWPLAMLLSVCSAWAQETFPHIGYAYPAGGRQGATLRITLGGQYLNDISRVYFSGDGVEAHLVPGNKPMTEADVRALRDRLTQLAKNQKELSTRREIATISRKLALHMAAQQRRQTQPAISETVELEVNIRGDAQPGPRELRVESSRGVSNPLHFCVGVLPEFHEQEPELVTDVQGWNIPIRFPHTVTTDITLPAVVNGQIIPREPDVLRYVVGFTPGDADRYGFEARKGQTLVLAVSARQLIPYLADAVPGWFQATLTLHDAQGKELAFDDDYRFHPDPVLVFKVPADGRYVVEIKDAIYRGRPDFVYRIAIGELPFITGIFPLGGRAGGETTVELKGHNLPVDRLTVAAKDKSAGIDLLSVRRGNLPSNTVPFALDTLPEALEKEPNDSARGAQPVTQPVIVNGRIDRPGDWDVFRFEGRAGQKLIAEVDARRLDSPVDSALELTDAAGKRLAFADDHEDKGDAVHTHHADSLISETLPADGTYFVRVGDAQREGGPEYAYRLRISPPRPDFALRVVPSCINALTWRLTPVSVFALRKDGFSGDIALSFKGSPEGIALGGAVIPAGQDFVQVTLAVASWLPADPMSVCLEGRATIDGEEVVRAAVPADDMMQAFFYRHLVPATDLKLVLTGRPRTQTPAQIPPPSRRNFQAPMEILSEQPVRIPAGGTAEVLIRASGVSDESPVQIELSDPPQGIAIRRVSRIERGVAIVFSAEADKAKPGLSGNLIGKASQMRTQTDKEGKKREYRANAGLLPAIPFQVVKQ